MPFSYWLHLYTLYELYVDHKLFIPGIVVGTYNLQACHEFFPVAQTLVSVEDTQRRTCFVQQKHPCLEQIQLHLLRVQVVTYQFVFALPVHDINRDIRKL